MSTRPLTFDLELTPTSRYDLIDVASMVRERSADVLTERQRALYCSFHTTAGFFEQALASRLEHRRDRLDPFVSAFRTIFPEGADYRHDQLELRDELSEEQKKVEPKNADSHLAFISSGLRNVATYVDHGEHPVYLVELDGMNGEVARRRRTKVIGYDDERKIVTRSCHVPVSQHPVDSINLRDETSGIPGAIRGLIADSGVEYGRIDINLAADERDAGLTVNEYETLLMRSDLAEVLRDPLRFAASSSRRAIENPRALAGKSLDYAKYDLVQVFNELMDAMKVSESVIERLLSRFLAVPASRFLRMKRHVSLLVVPGIDGQPEVLEGTYQSPILVQWRNHGAVRDLQLSLTEFS